ncbi:hypothetical protein TL16_g01110 [Triparma laevis f. inornata]|uniref:Uncharacterized protein n=1 Tax=Triparma laevis f. inornata TaxID=1714386 RepID=A0A9W6ZG13_9STRA|nr:hypothetical protein TL16_g01110 [Triparma laevis f. inornata]
MSGKRGAGDEEKEDGEEIIEIPSAESLTISTTDSTIPVPVDDFMNAIEFIRLFAPLVHEQTLMALRVLNKEWNGMADVLIDKGVRSGAMMVHDGKDISWGYYDPRKRRRKLVTRVIFLLNTMEVEESACWCAVNLVVVDVPEGVEHIGVGAFAYCSSLTSVSFPTTLTTIGLHAFNSCNSLDNVDLLHTNLQELGSGAFRDCSELKSMTIPDSLRTLGKFVFRECSKLVPSKIDVSEGNVDTTFKVVRYLRSKQQQQQTSDNESMWI